MKLLGGVPALTLTGLPGTKEYYENKFDKFVYHQLAAICRELGLPVEVASKMKGLAVDLAMYGINNRKGGKVT